MNRMTFWILKKIQTFPIQSQFQWKCSACRDSAVKLVSAIQEKKKNTDGEMKSLITSYHLHQQIQSWPSCWKAHIARRHGRNGHHGPGSISTSVSTGGCLSSTWVSKHHFPPATPRPRHCRQLLLLCTRYIYWKWHLTWHNLTAHCANTQRKASASCCLDKPWIQKGTKVLLFAPLTSIIILFPSFQEKHRDPTWFHCCCDHTLWPTTIKCRCT